MSIFMKLLLICIAMANLKIASYNCNGFGADRVKYINKLASENTFLLLQEHWLLKTQLDKIESEVNNVSSHSVSGVQCNELFVGRPYGGCAILWQKDFRARITPVQFHSSRLCGVTFTINNITILLCNVYMPVDTNHSQQNSVEYCSILAEITSSATSLNVSNIIIGGDFNTDFNRRTSIHTKDLNEYIRKESFVSWIQNSPDIIDYTCENFANRVTSILDHFILTQNLNGYVISRSVDHSGDNLSDHSPISITLKIKAPLDAPPCSNVHTKRPLWNKASPNDLLDYQNSVDRKLTAINLNTDALQCHDLKCCRNDHLEFINHLTNYILQSCSDSSSDHIPQSSSTSDDPKSDKKIPGWKEHVEPVRQTALFWHFLWQQCGSPLLGEVAGIRCRTREVYHRAVKQVKKMKDKHAANSMAKALSDNDINSFWNNVRKAKGTKTARPSTVDDLQGDPVIAQLFANKYNELYNSVSYSTEDMSALLKQVDDLIESKCCKGKCSFNHNISVDIVASSIKELKKGKHNGNFESQSDHFLNGTDRLNTLLSLLISCMLSHGYAPGELLLSTIIPIIKDKRKSKNSSDNYHGIALSSILGKLIDTIIIKCQSNVLSTTSLQFAYKEKSSTTQCTFVANEVINYYVSHKSNVYCVFLDASKAFDRVQFVKLFKLLLENNMCPVIARFLAYLYTNQQCCTRWAGDISKLFEVSNGVKQGGVLSPHLFNVYIDVLLSKLKHSGFGCHIGNTFTGALAYADDVLLLCPTVSGLNVLISICETYSKEYNILFNVSKSKFLTFGATHPEVIDIKLHGNSIPHVNNETHLGHLFGSDPDIFSQSVKQAVCSMFSKLNLLLRQFIKADCDLKYHLYKLYCLSVYGCQLWDFESPKVSAFFHIMA